MIEFFEQYGNIVAGIFLVVYYLPIIIAIKRRHQNIIGLGILNFFFGWTIIGWFAALIWSVSHNESSSNAKVKPNTSVGEELERLARLREEGHLTQEEFKKEKRRLLQ